MSILRGVEFLLAAIEQNAGVPILHVHFSSKGFSVQLDGILQNSGVHGVLEGKNNRAVDIVSSDIEDCIDRAKGLQKDENITGVQRMYYDMVSKVVSWNCGRGWFGTRLK